MKALVHWHEGLFLQPHHLQLMQRSLVEGSAAERRLLRPYPYGLADSKIIADELDTMRVRFERLLAVMPSGLIVDYPNNADLPALDIRRAFEASAEAIPISLAVPLYQPGRANTVPLGTPGGAVKSLYNIGEIELPDDATGEQPQPVQVRRINARLLLPGDDSSDMETLPLLRIEHASGQDAGRPRVDPGFIPPCIVVTGVPALRDLVRDIANQIEAARGELVVQLSRGGFNPEAVRGLQLMQLFRLRSLNGHAGAMSSLANAPGGISPFEVYQLLASLMGELAALAPDNDMGEPPAYDHEAQAPVFRSLRERLRTLLTPAATQTWQKADFADSNGGLEVTISAEQLSGASEFYLGITCPGDPRALASAVENSDEFKLMAKSMADMRIRGVKLAEERHPPVQLPSNAKLHYFRLDRAESGRMWERIEEDKALAIRFPGMASLGIESISLYMTMPS